MACDGPVSQFRGDSKEGQAPIQYEEPSQASTTGKAAKDGLGAFADLSVFIHELDRALKGILWDLWIIARHLLSGLKVHLGTHEAAGQEDTAATKATITVVNAGGSGH